MFVRSLIFDYWPMSISEMDTTHSKTDQRAIRQTLRTTAIEKTKVVCAEIEKA